MDDPNGAYDGLFSTYTCYTILTCYKTSGDGEDVTKTNGPEYTIYIGASGKGYLSDPANCPVEATDSDGDGVPDSDDAFPNDPNESADSDDDGTGDNADQCPGDPGKTAPLQCGCGNAETNTDGDGAADCVDQCPNDPDKTEPLQCGCGKEEGSCDVPTDTDGDGVPDDEDAFPEDPDESVDNDSDGTGDNADTDDDNDGVADNEDAFPQDATESSDTDGDGTGDNADTDDDGDGVADGEDVCPLDSNKSASAGDCGCGVAEGSCGTVQECSISADDTDGDCVRNVLDNCPSVKNPHQIDTDGDRDGDACDANDNSISNVYKRYLGKDLTLDSTFKRAGFSFAQPVITFIPGYFVNKTVDSVQVKYYKPVVIISGGYDPTKDYIGDFAATPVGAVNQEGIAGVTGSSPNSSGKRKSDSLGNAVYIVDAVSGALVAKIVGDTTYANGTASGETNTSAIRVVENMDHGIAAAVTPVDADGDGLVERLYYPDVVGNIWRADLILDSNFNTDNPTETVDTTKWQVYKLAALGVDDENDGEIASNYASNDRRFFNQIDVVRTRKGDLLFDAVLVGSGNIANPKETDVDNYFYMLRDERINLFSGHTLTGQTWSFTTPDVITHDDLTQFTLDSDSSAQALSSSDKGWKLKLVQDAEKGEKVMSSATTLDGTVYFTTMLPGTNDACSAPQNLPTGRLYAVDMHNAGKINNRNTTDFHDNNGEGRFKQLDSNTLVFQQLDPFVADGGKVEIILPDPGDGQTNAGGDTGSGKNLKGAGSYWRSQQQ